MASGARKSPSATIDPARSGTHRAVGRVIEYQQYIDGQLRKTRARVKWVDFWTSLVLLGIGVLGYLLVAALIDHWIIPGGLGFFGRLLLLVGLLAGIGAHLALNFFPHVLRRVNPVYAAAAIERGQPMKNTLVNFLLLRRRPEEVPEAMLEAMKEQAAVRLSGVPGDAPVDRTALIRWGYVLIAVLIAAVGYSLAGPKDALRSMGRVMAPWADLAAPTRVSIVELTPGDVDKRRDDVVEINLRTRGMRAADAAAVYYSPSGLPEDDVAVPLQSDDQMHWKAVLPAGGTGLQQDVFYYVQVGDTQSPRYRVRVLATPVISVASVRYEYPAYTGLPPRTVDGQGDLKALEGTRVVLTADANQSIGAAYVAFDQARNKDVELAPDASKRKAIGNFHLDLTKDRTKPLHASYVLRFTNIDGQENPKPIEHRIEVTADQPPELKVVEPTSPPEKELQVAVGDALRITLAAQDVDFQLAKLSVVFERYGAEFREEQLLLEPRYEPFSNTFVFEPGRYGLKPGDKLNFRGRAKDNRTPEPNVVESARYTIIVAGGTANPNQQQQQPPQQGNSQDQPKQQQNPNEQMPGRPPERGAPNPDQPPPNGPPQNGDQAKNDPQNNAARQNPNQQPQPGRQQQPGQQQPNGQNGQPQDPGAPQQQQPGMQQNGDPAKGQPQDGGRENGMPQSGDRQNGKNGEQGNADQRQGAAGDQASAGNKQQEEKPIDPTVDPGRAFEELQRHFDKQAGDKQNKNDAGKQPEQHASAADQRQQDRQPGGQQQQQQSGAPKPGEQKPDERQSGGGMNQQPKSEAGQPGGEKRPGEQQSGDKADGNFGGAKPEQGMADKHGRDQEPQDQKNGAGRKPGEKEEPGETGSGKRGGSGGQEGGGKTEGNQGSESGSGGQGSNQQKPSDQKNGAAGGTPEAMQKQDGAQGSGAEQRPGDNNGQGREVSRKPTDGAGAKPGEENRAAGDKPESMQGAQPTDKPAAGDRSGDPNAAPAPGGNRPEQKPPQPGDDAQNPSQKMGGNPAPDRQGKQAEKGDSGATGGAAPEQGKKPQQQPGEQSPTSEGGAKPSANAQQPSGNDNPGGAKGSSPNEGSPEQQGMTKPRDKTGAASQANQQESSEKSEGQSPSGSKNESDSQGDTSGDQSGKGEQGGGMKSNQKGTGAAGSNTAGDQGAGAANEAGDAATGNQAGDKVRSQSPTGGRPSGDKGDGSNTQSGGRQPGGKSDSAQTGGRPEGDPSQRQNPTDVQDANRRGGANSGGGGRPEGDADPRPRQAPEPGGDEANLEYTKKVTDLTLDRLKNDLEKGNVDPELLKRFSSREALEQFVRRWDEMRKAAAQQGPQGDEARKQFTDTLKGLGLRPRTTEQAGARTGDDDSRQLRGARRSAPPAKFADQYRAYTTGIGQGEEK